MLLSSCWIRVTNDGFLRRMKVDADEFSTWFFIYKSSLGLYSKSRIFFFVKESRTNCEVRSSPK